MLASDVLALLDAGSGKQAAQPRCPSPTPLQASRSVIRGCGCRAPSLGASRRTRSQRLAQRQQPLLPASGSTCPAALRRSLGSIGGTKRATRAAGSPHSPHWDACPFAPPPHGGPAGPPSPQERQKRPRLCHTHVVHTGSPEEQLAGQCSSSLPTPALPEQATSAVTPKADAADGAALASDTLPWQASYLMEYVQRCLEALTAMYPQCAPIQTRTRASQMAVALFRCAACTGRYTGAVRGVAGAHAMPLVGWWAQLVQQWPAVDGGPSWGALTPLLSGTLMRKGYALAMDAM